MGLVETWLAGIGLGYAIVSFKTQGISSPDELAQLSLYDFDELGVIDPNDRKKLFYLVQRVCIALNKGENSKSRDSDGKKTKEDGSDMDATRGPDAASWEGPKSTRNRGRALRKSGKDDREDHPTKELCGEKVLLGDEGERTTRSSTVGSGGTTSQRPTSHQRTRTPHGSGEQKEPLAEALRTLKEESRAARQGDKPSISRAVVAGSQDRSITGFRGQEVAHAQPTSAYSNHHEKPRNHVQRISPPEPVTGGLNRAPNRAKASQPTRHVRAASSSMVTSPSTTLQGHPPPSLSAPGPLVRRRSARVSTKTGDGGHPTPDVTWTTALTQGSKTRPTRHSPVSGAETANTSCRAQKKVSNLSVSTGTGNGGYHSKSNGKTVPQSLEQQGPTPEVTSRRSVVRRRSSSSSIKLTTDRKRNPDANSVSPRSQFPPARSSTVPPSLSGAQTGQESPHSRGGQTRGEGGLGRKGSSSSLLPGSAIGGVRASLRQEAKSASVERIAQKGERPSWSKGIGRLKGHILGPSESGRELQRRNGRSSSLNRQFQGVDMKAAGRETSSREAGLSGAGSKPGTKVSTGSDADSGVGAWTGPGPGTGTGTRSGTNPVERPGAQAETGVRAGGGGGPEDGHGGGAGAGDGLQIRTAEAVRLIAAHRDEVRSALLVARREMDLVNTADGDRRPAALLSYVQEMEGMLDKKLAVAGRLRAELDSYLSLRVSVSRGV
ncbi:unnamed protein product, partial [Choristocarpus tenellus]